MFDIFCNLLVSFRLVASFCFHSTMDNSVTSTPVSSSKKRTAVPVKRKLEAVKFSEKTSVTAAAKKYGG